MSALAGSARGAASSGRGGGLTRRGAGGHREERARRGVSCDPIMHKVYSYMPRASSSGVRAARPAPDRRTLSHCHAGLLEVVEAVEAEAAPRHTRAAHRALPARSILILPRAPIGQIDIGKRSRRVPRSFGLTTRSIGQRSLRPCRQSPPARRPRRRGRASYGGRRSRARAECQRLRLRVRQLPASARHSRRMTGRA